MEHSRLNEIHSFWLGDLPSFEYFPEDKFPLWFVQNDDTDSAIRERFGELIQKAIDHAWDVDLLTPSQQLGLVVLLDQFSAKCISGHSSSLRS